MQRHILRRLPRTIARSSAAATTAKASSASLLSRQFSSEVQVKQTNLFINNKFTPSASGATFDSFNPATEEKIASISEATTADVDAAVDAARAAFNGPWRTMDAAERGRLLFRLADLIEQNGEELAKLEALDAGKPSFLTRVLDVQASLNVYRYYAGWADKIHGSTVPISGPYLCYTKQEPVGVCGQIIPWNFPMIMMAWKLAPLLPRVTPWCSSPPSRRR